MAASTTTTTEKKPLSKAEFLARISKSMGDDFTPRIIAGCLDAIRDLALKEMGRRGPGVVSIPGLVKLERRRKPARKARPGRNPATGEMMTFPAKPARDVVKATPLKALRDAL